MVGPGLGLSSRTAAPTKYTQSMPLDFVLWGSLSVASRPEGRRRNCSTRRERVACVRQRTRHHRRAAASRSFRPRYMASIWGWYRFCSWGRLSFMEGVIRSLSTLQGGRARGAGKGCRGGAQGRARQAPTGGTRQAAVRMPETLSPASFSLHQQKLQYPAPIDPQSSTQIPHALRRASPEGLRLDDEVAHHLKALEPRPLARLGHLAQQRRLHLGAPRRGLAAVRVQPARRGDDDGDERRLQGVAVHPDLLYGLAVAVASLEMFDRDVLACRWEAI